ncbi:hypothetical protein [Pseudomonas sp. Marseille-Q0931]|uniref:hypothetical protein n=1 Tax=Pseudomonas sp. Marseille-Q0931 TaxID=2697507 RepID=UPI0023B94171|nr:hypothetical protein [Pseudomonas sp. Marseille-Q0931]
MPKATELSQLAAAADDAVQQITCRVTYGKWLDALANSIHCALEGGEACLDSRIERAVALASLAQFLAHDLTQDLQRDASELQAAVDSAQAKE